MSRNHRLIPVRIRLIISNSNQKKLRITPTPANSINRAKSRLYWLMSWLMMVSGDFVSFWVDVLINCDPAKERRSATGNVPSRHTPIYQKKAQNASVIVVSISQSMVCKESSLMFCLFRMIVRSCYLSKA